MLLADRINCIVEEAIERRIFPGAVVLVARADTIQHYAAYGTTMYDASGSRLVGFDTIYDIASLTKVFTATAALRLVDDGRLDLHAPVVGYLPELRAPGITAIHLLTHTSGLNIRLSTLRHAGRADILAAAYAAEPLHPPGTAVAYTNVNSLLLGEIVARLCGAPLDAAIRALVLDPLELRDTQFCPPPALLPRIAPTEIDDHWRGRLVHGSVHDESAYALGGVAGHAGLFSTAADLYAFCRMWLDDELADDGRQPTDDERRRLDASGPDYASPLSAGVAKRPRPRLLRPETIALARANHTPKLAWACGLGWMMNRPHFMGAAPDATIGHTGFTGPAIVIVPQERLIVVVLCNRIYPRRRPPDHHAVIAAIVNAALGQQLE